MSGVFAFLCIIALAAVVGVVCNAFDGDRAE